MSPAANGEGVATPLLSLLSQALIAFTIECDNEFEHRLEHRTSRFGRTGRARDAPWLVSLAMWLNCMRFVDEDGVTAGELLALARTPTNLAGMKRWGYVTLTEPAGAARRRRSQVIVRASAAGMRSRSVWSPLVAEVEQRWRERAGGETLERLCGVLAELDVGAGTVLPDCMPILGHGLMCTGRGRLLAAERVAAREPDRSLPALLARSLLGLAVAFEPGSQLSLAIVANLLRPLSERATATADLPSATGVSSESLAMASGVLVKRGLAVIAAHPDGRRRRAIHLTAQGLDQRAVHLAHLQQIERDWPATIGTGRAGSVTDLLERLAGTPGDPASPLALAVLPKAGGWRARVPAPGTLAHFPVVLHRGGFPDGS